MTIKDSSFPSPPEPYKDRLIDPSQLDPFLHHVVEIDGVKLEIEQIVKGILSEIELARPDHPYLEDCEVSFVGRYVTQLLVKRDCQTNDIDIKVKMPYTPEGLDISNLSLLLEKIVENSLSKLLKLEGPYRENFKKKPGLCPELLTLRDKLAIENYSLPSGTTELPVEISLNTLKDATVPTSDLYDGSFCITFALFDGKLGSKKAGPGEFRLYSLAGPISQIEETVKLCKVRTTALPNESFEQIWFRIVKNITVDKGWDLDAKQNKEFFAKEAKAGELILKNMDSFISKKKLKEPLFYLVNTLFLLPPEDPFPALFLGHLQKNLLKKTENPAPEWLPFLQKVLQEEKNPQEAISLLKGLMPLFAEEVSLKEDNHYQCTFTVNGRNYYILVPPFTEQEKILLSSRRIPQFPLTVSNVKENLAIMDLKDFLFQLKKSLSLASSVEDKTKLSCGSLKQILDHQDKLETIPPLFWEEATIILSLAISEQSKAKPWKDLLMLLIPRIKEAPQEEMKTFLRTLFQKVDALPLPMKEKDPFFYPLHERALLGKPLDLEGFLDQEITPSHTEEIKKCCSLWNMEDPFNFNDNFRTLLQEPEKALKLLEMQLAIENSPDGKIRIALIAYQICKKNPEITLFLEKEIFTKIIPVAEDLQVPYQEILNKRIKHNITEKKPILACNLLKCLPPEDPSISSHLSNLLRACSTNPEKAIQLIQSHFEHHWIAILKEIKEPSLKNTLLTALSRSPNESLQEECLNAFEEDIPRFLALNRDDPLKTIKPLLDKASITRKFNLAQKCIMLADQVDKKVWQDLLNLLVTDANVDSYLQEVPQTIDCLGKWMDFLIPGKLMSEARAIQLFERIQRVQEDPINKLALINRLHPFLKEEDKIVCAEELVRSMQAAIDQNEPLERILPFTTFLLETAGSEKIRSYCFSFFVSNLEKITRLPNTNQNRNTLFKQAEVYFPSSHTQLKAAFVNKRLTLPYDLGPLTLLEAIIANTDNCDFLKESSDLWNNDKINNGLIFLQANPENMKKFIRFASKNMIEFPTSEIIKKMGPHLEEDSRLALFEKGLEELNNLTTAPKRADMEKSLLILLKSSSNKPKLAQTALERLDFYPTGIIKEISSDWKENLISIFIQKIKIQADVIKKLKGPSLEALSINYINCFTEIEKIQRLLERPDVYIPFAKVAYPYIDSLTLNAAEQKTNKTVGIIKSLIKKPFDWSRIPIENQSNALLVLFSCPTFLATQNNIQLLHALKTCPPLLITQKISDKLLRLPSEQKALWIQSLISQLETSSINEDVMFRSLQTHLENGNSRLLEILSLSESTVMGDAESKSTLMKLCDLMIKHRTLPSDKVSACTRALRSILLKNPTLKGCEDLAFNLLKAVHSFRLNSHNSETPLAIQIDFQEYIDFLEKLEVPKGHLIAYLKSERLFLGNSNLYSILKVYDKPQPIFIIKDISIHLALINRIRIHKGTKSENLEIDTSATMLSLYLLSFMCYPNKIPEDDKNNFYQFAKNNIKNPLPLNFLLHEITGDKKIQKFHELVYLSILPAILELSIKELRSLEPEKLESIILDQKSTLIISSASMLLQYLTSSSDLPAHELKEYLLYMIPKLLPDADDLETFFSYYENYVQTGPLPEPFAAPTKRLDYALFLMDLTNHMMGAFMEGKAAPGTLDYLTYKTEQNLSIVSEYLKHDLKPDVIAKLKAIRQENNLPQEKIPALLQDIFNILDTKP